MNSNSDNNNNNTVEEKVTINSKEELCEECKTVKFKYKCPACFRKTCSLKCVNSHKKIHGCSGKKDTTAFLPLSQFDDSTLLNDYNLLQDMKRVAESSQRMRAQLCAYNQHRLPTQLKALQNAAAKRRTRLLFFPTGMSKRQKNQTRVIGRQKYIKWTIEWRFHSTAIALLEHMVNENSTLRSVVRKHLQPSPWRNKLRRFTEVPVDNLKLFIRKNQKETDSPYRELDLDTPLRELLSGLLILEYPTILILLPSDPCNFKIIQDLKRSPKVVTPPKAPIPDDIPTPVFICSKEEEIIEDGSPETKILDFLDKPIKETTRTSPTSSHAQEGKNAHPSTKVEMLKTSIDDFEFDQELMDAYSLLMEQGNPSDFLHHNPQGDGEDDHINTDMFFAELEELEEGEIPNSD